ncbi:GMC family oxidoreductase N-terminal domain-containing protein [Streptomyces abyssomicinicus]|uniref:GMC family oxidoreductase N-terminal domain-containing protein n=1 Tax=Streptomyces abyssomicinicus TaxID=574929 RepID=UPI00124FA0AC|nr:GMC oxidoreductase [Streptomyces abyssomicinicus]
MGSTRRTLLTSAAALGATALTTRPAHARVRLTRESHRVLVIGSGFGGGVTALRLAQAGIPVTVLERGRWWPTGPNADTFATLDQFDRRALWYGTLPEALRPLARLGLRPAKLDPYVGVMELVPGINTLPICGAGVGGTSLIYNSMTIQPSEAVFNTWLPEGLDYRRMDRVHYPRAATLLKPSGAPDELIASRTYAVERAFADGARRAGHRIEKYPLAIDWAYPMAEVRGEVAPAFTTGEINFGVNNGGKYSVDRTYIAQALSTGNCTVATHHRVTSVARARDGRWTVHVDRTDDSGRTVEQKILTTGSLFVSAGCLNTSRLLVRAKALGHVPDLPDAVGEGYGSNGDRFYLWTSPLERFGVVQGGPGLHISKDWTDPRTATSLTHSPLLGAPAGLAGSAFVWGMGVSPDRGRFTYNGLTDTVDLTFPAGGDRASARVMGRRMAEITRGLGTLVDLTDVLNGLTAHPLGGACMEAVTDLEGRVLGQDGLYVMDGSLIPGTAGACNPSFTIAAVAERALERIVANEEV